MNAPAPDSFHGSRAVSDVIERIRPLADRLRATRPDYRVITVSRRDLDVLLRYAATAQSFHDVTTSSNGVTYWHGFELRAHAVSRPQ